MKYYIFDPDKVHLSTSKKYVLQNKLLFLDNTKNIRDLDIIFVATSYNHLYEYCRLNRENNVFLVVENSLLKREFKKAKFIMIFTFNVFLKRFQ